jgi:DsbC/DsbD-like thiol-disulfide interchange protein
MKKIIFILLILVIAINGFSQVKDPVKWSYSVKKIDASTFEINLTATLESGWHIYSQTTPDGGPSATLITFTKNPLLQVDGTAKEFGKLEQKHEDLFDVDVKQFSGNVSFVQTVKLKGKAKTSITGTIEFMTCNNRECLPPRSQKFSIVLQ